MRRLGRHSKYRFIGEGGRSTNHQGKHMIYTEAQDLGEALDIIAARKAKRTGWRSRSDVFGERGLSDRPNPKITLPSLKWLRQD